LQELLQNMVETYGDKIYRLALRYTGDRDQAQDLTQETFLRAFKNLGRFDHSKEPGPWLFKIAANLCRNWLRDNREIPVESMEDYNLTTGSSPEKVYFDRENERELALALDRLPQIYREVILLKHVGELSYAEICETLGLELSLVKNRLYRGRTLLKDLLLKGSEYEDD
jgi:RNA polymerase sigma-70 factor (ECF subfamily)